MSSKLLSSLPRTTEADLPRIVDKDEVEIEEPCVDGEIFVKAEYPMLGYFNNEAATQSAFAPGGWIRTGDVGHVDENGLYFITDRKKDLIKIHGWQVSPTELEEVLLMHDNIVDAAVIGVNLKQPSTEEEPHAYIVRRPGSQLSEDDVKAWMRLRLARFKVAEKIMFMDSLPRNPTGKILRRFLPSAYDNHCEAMKKKEVVEQNRIPGFAPEIRHGSGVDTQIIVTPADEKCEPVASMDGASDGIVEVIRREHGTDCTCLECENDYKENSERGMENLQIGGCEEKSFL